MEPLKTTNKPKNPLYLNQTDISDFQKLSTTKKYYCYSCKKNSVKFLSKIQQSNVLIVLVKSVKKFFLPTTRIYYLQINSPLFQQTMSQSQPC